MRRHTRPEVAQEDELFTLLSQRCLLRGLRDQSQTMTQIGTMDRRYDWATMTLLSAASSNSSSVGFTNLETAAVVIPTFNAAGGWVRLLEGLEAQEVSSGQVLVVDSSSTDGTRDLVRQAGFRLEVIPQSSFRHGATRQMAAELVPDASSLIYLTQDAVPVGNNAFKNLLAAFEDPLVGAAYGRQLPREGADPIEAHTRLFNYPPLSDVRSFAHRETHGMRTAFFSNSFAAYRRSAFEEVGGFPLDVNVSEDVTVAARMLMAGWRVAYQADATVIHSHPFQLSQEFDRYFNIGLHHGYESWLLEAFGQAGAEGRRFVVSEIKYLWRHKPSMIPWAALRTLNKFAGYQMGKRKGRLSQQKTPRTLAGLEAGCERPGTHEACTNSRQNSGANNGQSDSALRHGSA